MRLIIAACVLVYLAVLGSVFGKVLDHAGAGVAQFVDVVRGE